jgi:hypothetical protein
MAFCSIANSTMVGNIVSKKNIFERDKEKNRKIACVYVCACVRGRGREREGGKERE